MIYWCQYISFFPKIGNRNRLSPFATAVQLNTEVSNVEKHVNCKQKEVYKL